MAFFHTPACAGSTSNGHRLAFQNLVYLRMRGDRPDIVTPESDVQSLPRMRGDRPIH